jgi:hypothetical protein
MAGLAVPVRHRTVGGESEQTFGRGGVRVVASRTNLSAEIIAGMPFHQVIVSEFMTLGTELRLVRDEKR